MQVFKKLSIFKDLKLISVWLSSMEMTDDEAKKALVSWNVTEFNNEEFLIKLKFKDPLLISSSYMKDKLKVKINKHIFFITSMGEGL